MQRALDKRLADPKRGTYASLVNPDKGDLALKHASTMQPTYFNLAQTRGRLNEQSRAPPRRARSADRDDRPRSAALPAIKPKLAVSSSARPSTSHV